MGTLPMRPVMKPNDIHIVLSHARRTAKAFVPGGKLLWKAAALTEGVADDVDLPGGDTPMGLYKCGLITKTQPDEPAHIWASYGPWFIDLIDLENQETGRGRAGIGMHGGGTGLANPLADDQPLIATHGCVRWKNGFLRRALIPLVHDVQKQGGTVYVTVTA